MYEQTVLIVGAGPAGLTLALDLARRGIPFRLIDAAETPFAGSRGKGIQPRTLEILEDLGLIETILAAGALIRSSGFTSVPFRCEQARWVPPENQRKVCPIQTFGWCRNRARNPSCASAYARWAGTSNSEKR